MTSWRKSTKKRYEDPWKTWAIAGVLKGTNVHFKILRLIFWSLLPVSFENETWRTEQSECTDHVYLSSTT